MGKDLRQMFDKAIGNKKLNKFYEYLSTNNLEKEFIIQNCFRESDENISFFALKMGMTFLRKTYGENLGNKMGSILFNEKYTTQRNFELLTLIGNLPETPISEKDVTYIEKVLDIASQEEYCTGVHITGNEIGPTIEKTGIALTSHTATKNGNETIIMEKLMNNIHLYKENAPISIMLRTIYERGYNDRGTKYNDIIIVAIPKKDLIQNNSKIIAKDEKGREYLNPIYNAGYVRIDKESGHIEGLYESPYSTMQKLEQEESKEWEEKLDEWYQSYSRTPNILKVKFEEITKRLKNIFRKPKQLPPPNEEKQINNVSIQRSDFIDRIKYQVPISTKEQKKRTENDKNLNKDNSLKER